MMWQKMTGIFTRILAYILGVARVIAEVVFLLFAICVIVLAR